MRLERLISTKDKGMLKDSQNGQGVAGIPGPFSLGSDTIKQQHIVAVREKAFYNQDHYFPGNGSKERTCVPMDPK